MKLILSCVNKTGRIEAVFFNESCDKFWNELQVGTTYIFKNGRVRPTNYKKHHSFEVTFEESDAQFVEVEGPKYITLDELEQANDGDSVNVASIVVGCGEITEIIRKRDGMAMSKRELELQDGTGTVCLTLWDELAIQDSSVWEGNPAFVATGLKVKTFQGSNSVSMSSSGNRIEEGPVVDAIREWWNTRDANWTGGKSIGTNDAVGSVQTGSKRSLSDTEGVTSGNDSESCKQLKTE